MGNVTSLIENPKLLITTTVLSGIALLLGFFDPLSGILPFDIAWTAIILSGFPIIYGAVSGLIFRFDIKADVLVSLALIASVIIGEYFAAGEVAFIMMIGKLLEDFTAAKARAGIGKLVRLTPQSARVVRDNGECIIPCEQVRPEEIIRILPGETIAVDGIIISGSTSIDQSVMTGESLPVDKSAGDEVFSGTVNQYGAIDIKAAKVGEDSSIKRMIRLVREADANKAPIVRITDRWAAWIVLIALSAAALTWFISGEVIRAVTVLVVFCPCALVLATPTAIMAAIGNAAKYGILIRSGDALERVAKSTIVTFDKTGTLTYGKPEVIAVKSFSPGLSEDDILTLAGMAEARSEHPLGKTIVRYARAKNLPLKDPEEFSAIPGRGVAVKAGGKQIHAGNHTFITEKTGELPPDMSASGGSYVHEGATVIYLALDGIAAGIIALSDTLRNNAPLVIKSLAEKHIKPVLLTGDNREAALYIARELGIADVKYELLPEDKAAEIQKLQADTSQKVCMIGDGINDAPALKTAYTGIALGGVGSDIAVDASDIVLLSDDIKRIPYLIALSRKTLRKITVNVALSMALNFAAIILAVLGLLGPVAGALVHNAGSVLVVINSAFLLAEKDRYGKRGTLFTAP
ncbi:MAG: cation-translocating P-type ATPase [Spirochaetaceae bacterium]|nr:cation-translocating P-type ATPase [Spirochaetaceae bacterium]